MNRRRAVLLALLSAMAVAPAWAEETVCADLPASSLNVTRVFGDASIKVAASASDIEEAARKTGGSAPSAHPMMLSATKVIWQVKVDHQVTSRAGMYCATPSQVDIWIGFAPRTVLISREAAQVECLRRGLLDHHARHVRSGDEALEVFLPSTKEPLGRVLRQAKVTPFPTPEEAKENFERSVKAALRDITSTFERDLADIEARLDRPEEIERILSCKGGSGKGGAGKPRST